MNELIFADVYTSQILFCQRANQQKTQKDEELILLIKKIPWLKNQVCPMSSSLNMGTILDFYFDLLKQPNSGGCLSIKS